MFQLNDQVSFTRRDPKELQGERGFMAFINFATGEVGCKIVYYGPARCGKTMNLKYIYSKIRKYIVGRMTSIDNKGDATIFFDFLPLELGKIGGLSIRIQLYTVPGQVHHNATRKLVLEGVDGVVFVADSLRVRRDDNIESMLNLFDNLRDQGVNVKDIAIVLQFNKRDLMGGIAPILPLQTLEEDLNATLGAPTFPASATEGSGVYDTLRAVSKMAARSVCSKMRSHALVLSQGKNECTF
jgi:signal recognition particle receptor subunit beta